LSNSLWTGTRDITMGLSNTVPLGIHRLSA
jgi:hypothetical protein